MSWTENSKANFGVESMEERLLMAGDVEATKSGNTLTITGDDENNSVLIRQDGAGRIIVTGLRSGNGNATNTTIANGGGAASGNNGERVYTGIRNITIEMGDGNDEVFIEGISDSTGRSLRGNLTIDLGEGNDDLYLGSTERENGNDVLRNNGNQVESETNDDDEVLNKVSVDGRITIRGGAGADYFEITDTFVDGNFNLNGDGGADEVVINESDDDEGLDVGGTATINGGGGSDSIDGDDNIKGKKKLSSF